MDDKRIIDINRPQSLLQIINANKTYAMWGRAGGKTNGALGPRIMHLQQVMPRSQIGIVCPSYVMAFKQIINNIVGFWQNQMGLVQGEDFVICKKPPADWPKPLIPVLNYEYVISFSNGCAMPILSLQVEGSGNGFNMQALVGDEAKFFNEKKLKEITRAIRGSYTEFGHLPEFQSQWYFTDKFEGDVEWMIAKRKLMDQKVIKAVIAMQLEIYKLQHQQFDNEADYNKAKNVIGKYGKILTAVRKNLVYVSEASAEENREILGDKYFRDQKEDSTTIEYDVAIDNKDPDKAENSFYPELKEQHLYNLTDDIDTTLPLIIACDYQWRISPICTAQYNVLPGNKDITLNYVYDEYVEHPLGLTDAIDKWCYHFRYHSNKIVYYLFDKTAVGKSPTAQPYYETVVERLTYNGWNVVPVNMGEPPKHNDKFKQINNNLKGRPYKPAIRINALRNEDMLRSINLTRAIQYLGKTAKDKSSEKNNSIPAVKTTHFSDTFDMVIIGCLELDLVPMSEATGFTIILQ